MHYGHSNFSHLYIERAAEKYPMTEHLLSRFPKAERICIDNYKDVFARPGQHFQTQKRSIKLILAVKKDNLIYRGSNNAQDFGYSNFHYNALILNCVYNCDYCYLQGMYPSANIVVFVNTEAYFSATGKAIDQRADPATPLYLAISYDTDLLALESLVPYCREWIEYSRRKDNLLIEIRTKSANYRALSDLPPHNQVVLAWSLSPESVVSRYEINTPPLERRLESAAQAINDGWSVRLCFDPVLLIPNWRESYRQLIERTFEKLPAEKVRDISIGIFRMNAEYLKRIKKQRADSDILYFPYESNDRVVSPYQKEKDEMNTEISTLLEEYVDKEKIAVWM
jgi:spore photoproduct lyase